VLNLSLTSNLKSLIDIQCLGFKPVTLLVMLVKENTRWLYIYIIISGKPQQAPDIEQPTGKLPEVKEI
jgi:hypothetical protein